MTQRFVAPNGATSWRRVKTENAKLPAPNAQPHTTFHLAFRLQSLRIPHDNRHHLSLARPVIQIDHHDLLPGAERQLAVNDRNTDARLEQRRAYVRETVAIAPASGGRSGRSSARCDRARDADRSR